MKNTIIAFAACLLLIHACKDKDVPPSPPYEEVVEMSTPYGNMYIYLYKATPLHKANFLKLCKDSFFNQTTFHRVIPNFMIQGGDPLSKDQDTTNDGTGGPGYTIPAEIIDSIKHERGVLAAARLSDNVNPTRASSGSQFYISVSTSGTAGLDGKYTVFGYVMKGMEYADSIVKQKRDARDRPFVNQKMSCKIIYKTLAQLKSEYAYEPKN
jgi:cyclophilin family peptidyl-prolyl cis-trans isomerase